MQGRLLVMFGGMDLSKFATKTQIVHRDLAARMGAQENSLSLELSDLDGDGALDKIMVYMAGDNNLERKSGSVIYLDREGNEVLRFNFFEAWPVKIQKAPAGSSYQWSIQARPQGSVAN